MNLNELFNENKIGGRHDPEEFDAMVKRLGQKAKAGPMKTVWDPVKRVYKNVPVGQDKKNNVQKQGVAEGSLTEFAPGDSGASSYYAVTENFVNDFIEQKEEELQDRIDSGFSKEEIADMKQGFVSDMVYFEQVRDGFLKGMKPGFEAYRQGDTALKDQLGEYWLENNLPLNQDWEKIYGEPWGDDTGFNEGVAEGFNGISVDIEPELDYDVVYVDINGKRYNFNYWYSDEKPTNELEFRKDIPEYLKREEWYNKLDFPTKMEVLHAVVQAELGNEPSEYKPTVGDEPLDEIDRRGFLKGLGAAAATAAVPALAQAGSGIDYNKVQMLHDQMFKKNPQYAKEWQAANGERVRAFIKSKDPKFRDRATARKARLDMTAKILQKYGVKDLNENQSDLINDDDYYEYNVNTKEIVKHISGKHPIASKFNPLQREWPGRDAEHKIVKGLRAKYLKDDVVDEKVSDFIPDPLVNKHSIVKGWRKAKGLDEKAPPGDKAERMVKHIKQGYAKDGKLTDKEKSIAYATAWKAHNAGKV